MENFQEASHRKLGAVFSSLDSSFSDEDELRCIMDELDSDHNSFISLTKFAAFCCSSSEDGGSSELHDAFKLYDPSILMGIKAMYENQESVEKWRRQRRSLERLPSHLTDALLHRLIHCHLLFPSLLEYLLFFQNFELFEFSLNEFDDEP